MLQESLGEDLASPLVHTPIYFLIKQRVLLPVRGFPVAHLVQLFGIRAALQIPWHSVKITEGKEASKELLLRVGIFKVSTLMTAAGIWIHFCACYRSLLTAPL